jgi:hypothetical protein
VDAPLAGGNFSSRQVGDEVPYERVGSHRRLLLRNVLAYRDQRREEQYRALEATSVDIDDEEDIDEVLASLRDARRDIAKQRRSAL